MTSIGVSRLLGLLLVLCVASWLPAQPLRTTHQAAIHRTWSASSEVVGHLAPGSLVDGLSHRAGYTHVRTPDGALGWVYSRYLEPAATPPATADTTTGNGPLLIAAVAALSKPAPEEAHAPSCADVGSGTQRVDSATNLLKNRVDDGTYEPVSPAAILALPWQGMPTRRYHWDAGDSTRTAAYEGAAVTITGFIVDINPEGAEATNCGQHTSDWVDWHMWVVATKTEVEQGNKRYAIVAEVTPRVRARFAGRFVLDSIRRWRSDRRQVRVSGWLMLDPDHPSDATGTPSKSPSRGTIWEVHPVMSIEVVPP